MIQFPLFVPERLDTLLDNKSSIAEIIYAQ